MLSLFLFTFIGLLIIGIPVAIALGGSALIYSILRQGISPTMLIQTTFAGMASFPLLAIPLFILAGHLMNEGGITKDLVLFARVLLGHVRGGLGLAAILASAVFAAISGSAVATAVAIGSVLLPAMAEAGYDDDVSAAITATASCLGPIIPPSIPFIIYGVIANVSITALFLAGVIPGCLLAAALMIYTAIIARRRNYPLAPRASFAETVRVTARSMPALLMPVLILGGIIGGIFTPTEAAGISVVYAFLLGFFFYRHIRLSMLPRILLKAGVETAVVMLLIGLSEPFSWVIAVEQVPAKVMSIIMQFSSSPFIFLLLVNIVLLFIGIPLETAPALTIMTSVLVPLAEKMGIDPVHFGVIVCFNLVIGLITPPVGAVLFSICGISGLSLEKLSRSILMPFLVAVGVLLIITYAPILSTLLPAYFLHSIP